MKKNSLSLFVICVLALMPILKSCKGESPVDDTISTVEPALKITGLSNQAQYTIGEEITFELLVNRAEDVDSISVYFDGEEFAAELKKENQSVLIPTDSARVGKLEVKLLYLDLNGKKHQDVRSVIIFSEITPENRTVKVLNKYPHNNKSYTQGLEFYKGSLFESTGQYGTSFVAETNLKTGELKRQVALESNYFGEGMTIINDTLYQITYQAGKCKVYDLDFILINEFTYAGEGWGLTNDGENLIMSNGSDEIVWRDRHTFEVVKKIHVFSNMDSVVQLNELELFDGRLFANIYTDSKIVEIDPKNGKVLAYIDCSSIVNEQPAGVDYLNGIAYDSVSNKIVLTGKLWPTMYEVSFD